MTYIDFVFEIVNIDKIEQDDLYAYIYTCNVNNNCYMKFSSNKFYSIYKKYKVIMNDESTEESSYKCTKIGLQTLFVNHLTNFNLLKFDKEILKNLNMTELYDIQIVETYEENNNPINCCILNKHE